ncbi:DUF2812 domain-containing protein [Paenibacillus segetis]|uniref:DUF2812 domain-containing protein n=1 Tax=Paenibacillus segetis TaxID=1325360 RepID=A0ABQ1YSW9_9BACL|nr:DUF2812 domain-containing protein [Paenibacillus segetis]GGH36671.1 hypothetical protein GCM10008013_43700 [Paenibacillus segetis]
MRKNKTHRYIISWGTAFAEQKEMQKLGRLAQQGWQLESFSFLGYRLRKAEPQDLIYEIDYHTIQPSDMDDYVETFVAAGWNHVCSAGARIHVFSAPTGTAPIYSDRNTSYEKYSRTAKSVGIIALIFAIIALIGFGLTAYAGNKDSYAQSVYFLLGVVGSAIALPALMTYTAFMIRRRAMKKA